MVVGDIMTIGALTIDAGHSLARTAQKMAAHDVGLLPVTENRQLVGAISDRDIVVRALANQRDPERCKVRDIMTAQVAVCFEDQDVDEAAHLMKQQQIRRLFVLDKDQSLVGMLSLSDLAKRGRDEQVGGQVLEAVSDPPMPVQRGITE